MNNDDTRDRLNRVRRFMVSDRESRKKKSYPSRYAKMAETMQGSLVETPSGTYCLVKRLYPSGFVFGESVLEPIDVSGAVPLTSFAVEERKEQAVLRDLVFFDLETTGLGGAGAVAFLAGCGSITAEGFEVRQYLLPDYEDETAVLEHLLEELTDKRTIVSYNGAAFDLNLIRDRMIINRVAREVPSAGHIDLLHSARRLFKRRLGDCSLTNIEREIFGFHREGDIPGYLIPSVYFDWLGSEDLTAMEAVLEHNRFDILALYFLLRKVAAIFETEGSELDHVQDVYSLSRVYGRRRKLGKVTDMYERLEAETQQPLDPDILWYHSMAFKRSGDWEKAVGLWQKLSRFESREGYWANIELAKYFEHRAKDLLQAESCARRARQVCPYGARQRTLLDKRLQRLSRKLG
ncbi:MAG: hypothetical protein GY867_04050 [bacterium]|nr:hypothetical protein [bacterium]